MGKKVEKAQQQHPQGMSVDLHPFIDIPGQAVSIDKIVNSAKGDISIITHPCTVQYD
jgi:hypothetical protein